MPRRYLKEFRDLNNLHTYVFPEMEYEYDEVPELESPHQNILGGQYGVDLLGFAPSLLGPRIATVRYVLDGEDEDDFDTKLETMLSKLRLINKGRLFTNKGHWAYARMITAPSTSYTKGEHLWMPATPAFRLDTDWMAADEHTEGPFLINQISQDITVNNPGSVRTSVMRIMIEANTAAGFANPNIINLLNGYNVGTNRDSQSTNSKIRIYTGKPSMEYSNTVVPVYAADYGNRILGPNQALWFVLEPGNNLIRITTSGTPNWNLTFTFYPVFMT